MPRLTLSLLGTFRVALSETPVDAIESVRGRALLAYLACEGGRCHTREALAALLWPQQSQQRARQNLRRVLFNLRQALGSDPRGASYLLITRNDVCFNTASDHWLDVAAFTRLIEASRSHHHRRLESCPTCMDRIQQAVALYRGDFLAGLTLPDSDNFEEWRSFQHDALQSQMLQALGHLATYHEGRREYDLAAADLRRQLQVAPWREEAHRGLMRVLALNGQRGQALMQFEACQRVLRDQLSASPSPETLNLYRQIQAGELEPPLVEDYNPPYKGLYAFTEVDAGDYFGREAFAESLLQEIHEKPLVAVIGPSGSGKTSLIQAGLLPRLDALATDLLARRKPAPGAAQRLDWFTVYFRPGSDPVRALADALSPLLTPGESTEQLAAGLQSGQRTLDQIAIAVLENPPIEEGGDASHGTAPSRLLIVIDHFEEVFTLCTDRALRSAFFDILLRPMPAWAGGNGTQDGSRAALSESAGNPTTHQDCCRFTTLISLRADFIGMAMSHRPLADAMQSSTLILGPMNREELRRAIEKPAGQRGAHFEAGLVERLLDDVGDEPGSLPLLEFALALLWRMRRQDLLTHAAYETIGGVGGALARYANHVYKRLDPHDQQRARRIFVQLVQPGIGTEDTRRLATKEELGDENWRVIQHLADDRLVVTNQDSAGNMTAEVAHEALIRNWDLLRSWMEADRAFRTWQQRLRAALHQWEANEEDEGALLRGAPLAAALQWMQQRGEDVSEKEREFITASQELRVRERLAEERRQQQALAQAQAVAEAERRRAESQARASRIFRGLTFSLAAALTIAVIAAIFGLWQSQVAREQAEMAIRAQTTAEASTRRAEAEAARAEEEAQLAVARQFAAQAINLQQTHLDLSLLVGLESLKRAGPSADRNALLSQLHVDPMIHMFLHGDPTAAAILEFTPDGSALAAVDATGVATIWDADQGKASDKPLPEGTHAVIHQLSADGSTLALATDNAIVLWDLATGQAIGSPLVGHEVEVEEMHFTADGKTLVTSDEGQTTLIWDLTGGEIRERPPTQELGTARAVSPDGSKILFTASSGSRNMLSLWNTLSDTIVQTEEANDLADIATARFSPDGKQFATAGFDGMVQLWDAETLLPLADPLLNHDGRGLTLAYSADGRLLASGGTDNEVVLWDLKTGRQWGPRLNAHGNWVRSAAFSPDGRTLATGDQNGSIILWNLDRYQALEGHTDRVRSVALSPDDKTVWAASFDRTITRWDASTGELLQTIQTEHSSSIIALAISPAGDVMATGDATGGIILWDTDTSNPLQVMQLDTETVAVALAFSPDGTRLASGDFTGAINLWDVATGERLQSVADAHTEWALSLAFSPDGSLLVSGGFDTLIRLWDADTLAPLGEPLTGHTGWVTSLLFTADGQTLISGGGDQALRTWDVAKRQPIENPLAEADGQIWDLRQVQIDGKPILATLSADGSVNWWDPATGEAIAPPLRAGQESEDMAISTDGTLLFLGTFEPLVMAWQPDLTPWPERACRIANRNLTPEDWQKYLGDQPYDKTCPDLP